MGSDQRQRKKLDRATYIDDVFALVAFLTIGACAGRLQRDLNGVQVARGPSYFKDLFGHPVDIVPHSVHNEHPERQSDTCFRD